MIDLVSIIEISKARVFEIDLLSQLEERVEMERSILMFLLAHEEVEHV